MSHTIKNSLKSIVKSGSLVFLGTVGSMGVWFFVRIMLVRNTSVEELGTFALALSVTGVSQILATIAMDQSVTRYISIFKGESNESEARSVAYSGYALTAAFSILISIILITMAPLIAKHVFYKPHFTQILQVVALSVFFHVTSGILAAIARGYGDITSTVLREFMIPTFFGIALYSVLAMKLPFIYIIGGYLLALGLTFTVVGIQVYIKHRINPLLIKKNHHKKKLLLFSVPLLGSTVAWMILSQTDSFMLGRYAAMEDVGYYSIAMTIVRLMVLFSSSLEAMYVPVAGGLFANREMKELKRIYQVMTRWGLLATLPLFFICFFFPEMILLFFFGPGRELSAQALTILSISFISMVIFGPMISTLVTLGKTKELFYITSSTAVINIILNYLFIKHLGYKAEGAATATVIATMLSIIVTSITLYKHTGIHAFTKRFIRPIICSSMVGIAVYILSKQLPLTMGIMPLYLFLFVGGYLFFFLVTKSFDDEDVFLFETISRKTGFEMKLLRNILVKFRIPVSANIAEFQATDPTKSTDSKDLN